MTISSSPQPSSPEHERELEQERERAAAGEQRTEQPAGAKQLVRDVFKDISLPQLLAGALAAATSLFLATKIGIAGSIIGVAVASIITTISTAVYKNILARTQDKIKDALPLSQEGAPEPAAETRAAHDAHLAQEEAATAAAAGELDATRAWGAPATTPATSTYAKKNLEAASSAGATRQATQLMPQVAPEEPAAHAAGTTTPLTPWHFSEAPEDALPYATSEPYENPYGDAAPVHEATGDPHVASPALIAAARARKRHEQVKMALVALVAALIGVAITAALVLYFTHGEGLGSTQTLLSMPSRVTTTQDDAAAATTTTTPSATTDAATEATTPSTSTSAEKDSSESTDATSSSTSSGSHMGTSGSHTGSSTEPSTSTDGSSSTGTGSNSTTGSSESTSGTTGGSGTSTGAGSAGSAGDASSTTGSTTPSTSPDTSTSDSSK
jgi:hypothetical protein